MIIDYFKDMVLWEKLSQHNQHLLDVGKTYSYPRNYDLTKRQASPWINPFEVKYIPSPQFYPKVNKKILEDKRFNLIVHTSYYLPIFLTNIFFENNKSILIEDSGTGDGKFYYYLYKLGFHNFNVIDNFSHLPQSILEENLVGIPYTLNDLSRKPVVVTNVGCQSAFQNLAVRWANTIQLACCYTNDKFDSVEFLEKIKSWNYSFLCRDTYNIAIAFCRNDKYEEFLNKIKPYETNELIPFEST